MRGGYQPDSRVQTNGDETVITAMEWYRARTPDARRRARRELASLMHERFELLGHLNGGRGLGVANA